MAVLEELDTKCDDPECAGRASFEVKGRDGKRVGKFCRTHGPRMLKKVNEVERKHIHELEQKPRAVETS